MPIRPRTAALGAGVCVALMVAVWFAAFHIGFFERADQSIYLQFGDLPAHNGVDQVAGHLVSLFNPDHYAVLVLVPILVALFRGRRRIAFAAGTLILGANVTTELLKHLLAAPRPGALFPFGIAPVPPVSWPSGHSTAVMSLVLATVLTVPARLRPAVAAVGGCLAIGVGYSLLATGRHYPSDVLGGFLVASTWALLTVAALRAAEGRHPSARRSVERISMRAALGPIGAVLLAALLLSAIVVVSRPVHVFDYARAHAPFLVGAGGIAALGFALSTGVALAVRR
jgi:membrane-associated phospholipid phosphatase